MFDRFVFESRNSRKKLYSLTNKVIPKIVKPIKIEIWDQLNVCTSSGDFNQTQLLLCLLLAKHFKALLTLALCRPIYNDNTIFALFKVKSDSKTVVIF